jgi:hypothetical protein
MYEAWFGMIDPPRDYSAAKMRANFSNWWIGERRIG